MASIVKPELLLLDEHTAALDPKTSQSLMNLTDSLIADQELTALMVTHQMEDALNFGNRLIVMKDGQIIQDLNRQQKAEMQLEDYYKFFE